MPLKSKIIMLLNSLTAGLMVPVLSLAVIDKGASLGQLALIMGVYSFTVLAMELPTGIFADLYGRKRSFLVSTLFGALFALILLFAGNLPMLYLSAFLLGLGRSFSSGSMDALLMDQYIDTHGEEGIATISAQLSVLEAVGLSVGAVIGGALPGFAAEIHHEGGTYDVNLIIRLLLSITLAALVFIWVKESPTGKRKSDLSLKILLLQSLRLIKRSRTLPVICFGVFCTGFLLSTVEMYWQPSFVKILPGQGLLWILGILSSGIYLFASIGSFGMERLLVHKRVTALTGYWCGRIALSACVIAFSVQHNMPGFIGGYLLLYLLLGGSNIAESTLLNREIPSETRASMLSFSSLISHIGGLGASAAGSAAVGQAGIGTLWLYTGVVLFVVSAILGFVLKRNTSLNAPRHGSTEGDACTQAACADSVHMESN
jgi:MFS family permease